MKSLIVLSATIMVVFAACCTSSKTMASKENSNSTSLYETKWLLKKIYNEEGMREINTKAFIRFDKEKNSAGGNGSCNSFGSTTVINGNEVSFKNIFSTKIYCIEVQQTEDSFFKRLEKVNRFEVKNRVLVLYLDKEILLEFRAE